MKPRKLSRNIREQTRLIQKRIKQYQGHSKGKAKRKRELEMRWDMIWYVNLMRMGHICKAWKIENGIWKQKHRISMSWGASILGYCSIYISRNASCTSCKRFLLLYVYLLIISLYTACYDDMSKHILLKSCIFFFTRIAHHGFQRSSSIFCRMRYYIYISK